MQKKTNNATLVNIIALSLAFFFSTGAFVVFFNATNYVLYRQNQAYKNYDVKGTLGLSLMFFCHAVGNCLALMLWSYIGPRKSFLIGFIINMLYFCQFLVDLGYLYYCGCVMVGFSQSLCWTAQGKYLSLNSTKSTLRKHSYIFLSFMQSSSLIGNLLLLACVDKFDGKTRRCFYISLISITALSVVSILLMRQAQKPKEQHKFAISPPLREVLKFYKWKDKILVLILIIYCAMVKCWLIGIYSSSLAFISKLRVSQIHLISGSGFLISLGQFIAWIAFGIMADHTTKSGRYPIVLGGACCHILSYVLIFLYFPNNCIVQPTYDDPLLEAQEWVGFVCAFLLGFGESCFSTQCFGLITDTYIRNASAITFLSLLSNLTISVGFAMGTFSGIYAMVILRFILVFVATISFVFLEKIRSISDLSLQAELILDTTLDSRAPQRFL